MLYSAEKLTNKCQKGKTDCFAYGINRVCKILTDTRFNGSCPFYKTAEQRHNEHQKAIETLEENGKDHLISKYGIDNDHFKVWKEI